MTKVVQGPVARVANAYDSMFTHTLNVGFPATAIWQERFQCLEVLVQNDSGSANIAYIGNEFGQYVGLAAGESITIPINDLNKVYAGAPGGAATINFIAMT